MEIRGFGNFLIPLYIHFNSEPFGRMRLLIRASGFNRPESPLKMFILFSAKAIKYRQGISCYFSENLDTIG
jgi:hypothetical protein